MGRFFYASLCMTTAAQSGGAESVQSMVLDTRVRAVNQSEPQEFAAVVLLTTVPDLNLAKRIAHLLLEEGLAACIQIGQNSLSMYSWEGDVRGEQEVSLTIKTSERAVSAAIERLVELHPYEVPEAIVLPVIAGYGPYLDWIKANTRNTF